MDITFPRPRTGGISGPLIATVLGVAGGLLLWTGSILFVPSLRFGFDRVNGLSELEAAAAMVMCFICYLAYVRYSVARSWVALITACAFVVLALNQIFLGVVVGPLNARLGGQLRTYLWVSGRLIAGLLFVVAALPKLGFRTKMRPGKFRNLAAATLGATCLVEGTIWLIGPHLPKLAVATATSEVISHGRIPSLTIIDIALGVAGFVLYLGAAMLRLVRTETRSIPWLPIGLVLAAFSHLHYMLSPAVFSPSLSTGDFLRYAFITTLAGGLMWDLRRLYRLERQRSQMLRDAYAQERARLVELERLDRAKGEFFSILTHELFHPVAALRTGAVSLVRRWPFLEDEQRFELVERLEQESGRMREMVESAATLSQMAEPDFQLVIGPRGAVELAREGAEAVSELEGRLKVRVEPRAIDASVMADGPRVVQVLRNLLSNAEKYSDAQTPVELAVDADAAEVRFVVTNTGPGIEPDDLPRLFRRFSRIRPPGKENVPGSGLGLYISRRIVEALGGRFWVRSTPGEETSFAFSLPAAEVAR